MNNEKINNEQCKKIKNAFKNNKAFIPFITGGDPDLAVTEEILYALRDAGADIIEIGVPFSDPIAEGPVIESADERALANGCTTDKLFGLVSGVSGKIGVPLLFMTYYNPIFAYGSEKFVKNCAECGISGLIVPDLPFEERDELLTPCESAGLALISMIAPTSDERIADIAKNSAGFLYCVSSLGVTGERRSIGGSAKEMIARVKKVSDIPCAVGFGISVPEQAKEVAAYADGVIVGSAIVRVIAERGRDCVKTVYDFAKSIKEAIT